MAAWPKTYVVTSGEEAVQVVVEAARPPELLKQLEPEPK